MSELSIESRAGDGAPPATRLERLARRAVFRRLEGLEHGALLLHEGGRTWRFGGTAADDAPVAEVAVLDPAFYADVAFGGALGAGEAYVRGYWRTPDLTAVVRLLLGNRPVLERMERGLARLQAPLRRLFHWLHRNTRAGSRRNIAAHYDLGNDFFALWLDRRMMYSSAIFATPETSLEDAATAKLERICTKLELGPGDRVLEIGTGWGGFAIYAASRYGCHVTTTTISREQYDYACARVREAGLDDRITLLSCDYRDLPGSLDTSFDKLVSIEMIEAIGQRQFDEYFRICAGLLRPDGLMCLQAITIADQRYEAARRSVDFIQRYVFPGGGLPSVTALASSMTRSSDLRIVHLEDIGPHYATTLNHWRERFLARRDAVRRLGFPEHFLRLWHYYLCYCEGAFLERATGNVQLLAVRPGNRRPPFRQ